MAERNYTYLLRCADGTLYCGWTNDLEKRVAAHNAGTGAKYTKHAAPWSWRTSRRLRQSRRPCDARRRSSGSRGRKS